VHGTNAYAIGLKVEDAAATVERARVLGAELFDQPPRARRTDIPAIRGVGGGVIYFIDATASSPGSGRSSSSPWRTDTAAGGRPARRRPHRPDDELRGDADLGAVLHLDLPTHKTPMVDVVDPGGLVRSQVIENATARCGSR
jgi:4-hydroxyphenylpyruvate dioxygenase